MNTIQKLENAIGEIIVKIEENERIDRISKEKLTEQLQSLWNITGELKEERESTYDALQEVLNNL